MQQTLLGVLALVLASLMSFNQKRSATNNYERLVHNEIELAVTGSLTHVMEMVGSRAFDERTTPDGIDAIQALPENDDEFFQEDQFGHADRGEGGCDLGKPFLTPECDDVDDADGIKGQVVHTELSTGLTIPVLVDIDVEYVVDREVQTRSDLPTRHKLVVIRGTSSHLPNGSVQIERVFSYDPLESEMDYESRYGPIGTHDDGSAGGDDGGVINPTP